MHSGKKLFLEIGAAALALSAIIGAAAYAAGAGTSSDPLVTVSYLENTFGPGITASVNTQINSARSSLDSTLAARVRAFESNLATSAPSGGDITSEYVAYTLESGQTLDFAAGTEILFLSGSATSNAALTDTTAGAALSGALTQCHLYIATADGTITATGEANLLVK